METLENTDPILWASADPLLSAAEAEWFARHATILVAPKKKPLREKKRTLPHPDLCECQECKT